MKFSLQILENNKNIEQSILNSLLPEVNNYMNNGISIIKSELSNIIYNSIRNTPEYDSILSGKLKYEFGIPNPDEKLAGLLEIWSKNIEYQYIKPSIIGSKISAFFSANMIRIDFSDVLYTEYAMVVDGARGYSLPWLEWLLLEGNKTIIEQSIVVYGSSPFSRSGGALMKPSKSSWRVPSEFSGTSRDNWITRAIDQSQSSIESLFRKAFKS